LSEAIAVRWIRTATTVTPVTRLERICRFLIPDSLAYDPPGVRHAG
jgi:hypothetical protein